MIIFRYLAKEVYASVTAVMIVLLLIFMSNQFIRYLAQAAAGKLGAGLLVQLMFLQIPHLLGVLLPLAFYLAILLAYGRLYADSELLVMEASGFSQMRLMCMTLILGLGIAIPVAALNIWLEPAIAKQKDFILAQAGAKAIIQTIMPGRFQETNGGKRLYYVESMSRDRSEMNHIFIADNTPFSTDKTQTENEWWVVTADTAYSETDKETGDTFLVLKNGHRYLGKEGTKDYQIVDFSTYRMRLQEHEPTVSDSVDGNSTAELWRKRKTDSTSAAEFHWRISKIIAIFVLALLAVPFSHVNPRQGKYAKLLPAILLFILYFNTLLINQDWIIKQTFSWRIGMWPTHIIAALLGIILFIRPMGFSQILTYKRGTA